MTKQTTIKQTSKHGKQGNEQRNEQLNKQANIQISKQLQANVYTDIVSTINANVTKIYFETSIPMFTATKVHLCSPCSKSAVAASVLMINAEYPTSLSLQCVPANHSDRHIACARLGRSWALIGWQPSRNPIKGGDGRYVIYVKRR